jgi:hypothetical protein
MSTGYEHLDDAAFWAEVRGLLDLLIRHHGGTRASQVTGLAGYVRNEAERRDPELGANTARAVEMAKAAWRRACDSGADPLDFWDLDTYTPAETAEADQLGAAYRERFAALARG